jgi:Ca2+-transporting ATPase
MEAEAAWHSLETGDVLKKLGSSGQGLSAEEAGKRLQAYGFNEFMEKKKISPWTIFLNQFKSLLIIILVAAAVISVLIESWIDSVVIIIIVVLNAILGFRQE